MSSQVPALVRPQLRQEVRERDQQIICTSEQIGEGTRTETLGQSPKVDEIPEIKADLGIEKKQGYTKIIGKQTPQHGVVS